MKVYTRKTQQMAVGVARNNQKMKLPFSEVISEKVLRRLVKDNWSSVFEIASILEMPV